MYHKLLKLVNQHRKVLFLGDSGTGKSHMLRLLLSDTALREKVIIEHYQEVTFIQKNLKTGQHITFKPFENIFEVPRFIVNLNAPYLGIIDIPSIQPAKNGLSLFDLFKSDLTYSGEYKRKSQVNQRLKDNIDLMVIFNTSQETHVFQFGHKPELLNKIDTFSLAE